MKGLFCTILLSALCWSGLQAQLAEGEYHHKIDSLTEALYHICGGSDQQALVSLLDQYRQLAQEQSDWEEIFGVLDWQIYCASESEALEVLASGLAGMDSLLTVASDMMPDTMLTIRQITLNFFYGSYFHRLGDFSGAEPRFRKVLSMLEDDPENPLMEYKTSCYRYLGSMYRQQGNTQAAIEIYQQARAHSLALGNQSDWGLDSKYLADTYLQRNEYEEARSYYHESLQANRILLADQPDKLRLRNRIVATYQSMGTLFLQEGLADSSLYYLRQAEGLLEKSEAAIADVYQLLGETYLFRQDFSEAQHYFQLALAGRELQFGRQSLAVGESLRSLGELFTIQGDPTLGLSFFQQSLHSLVPGFEDLELSANPPLQGLFARKELLQSLGQKALALHLLAQQESDLSLPLPEMAYQTVQLAVSLIDSLKLGYTEDADKQLLLDESYPIIELGLELAAELYTEKQDPQFLEAIYRLMEKSRAVALFESLKTARAQDFAGIPPALQEEERDFRYQLSLIQDSLRQQKDPAEDPERLRRFQSLKMEYKTLISRFEQEFPTYYRLKYDLSVLPLEDLRNQLIGPETAMLEYFVGEEQLFLLDVRADTIYFSAQNKDFPLADWIQDFRMGIYDYFVSQTAYDDADYHRLSQQYTDAAFQLYQKLFDPYQGGKRKLPEQLMIVPDGMLGYLPFSALLTSSVVNPTQFQQHPYLLREHAIAYIPSASLWGEMQRQERKRSLRPRLLAFAPIFSGEGAALRSPWIRDSLQLDALPYTRKELEDIAAVFPTDTLFNENASLQHFYEQADEYSLLHLATHGVLNDSDPDLSFLAFFPNKESDGRLLLRELYAMDIPADLVVLSACETGIGRFSRGEGLLSLARGFSYAGTHSLLATLWLIPDGEVNRDLLPHFYQELKAGKNKAEAIRSAQLVHIEESFSHQFAHPFFWAAFTPMGDMRPLSRRSGPGWWAAFLGLLALVAALWWWRKKA